jgi:flagellar biosynthesis protein FliR
MKRFSVREAILVAIAVSLTVLVSTVWSRWHVPKLDTPYQAVLLTNNTVYIGRLQGFWNTLSRDARCVLHSDQG